MLSSPRFRSLLVPVSCLVAVVATAAEAPEKALKYHEALLKRPHNSALFDRFYGAWLDEQPVETLGEFLKSRATANGGQDLTVLATYQLRRGQEDEALETLGKAIGAVPEDPALPMERAKLLLRRLEFARARADLAAVATFKDEVLALEASKLIGKSWLREGRTEEAIKAWDAVLAAHPGDEDLLEDLIETAAAESEMTQALVYIGKLIEVSRDPYQKTLRMMRRGDLLAQAGKTDEAVGAYAATLDKVGAGSWLEREVLAQIEKLFRKQDRLDDLGTELKKLAETYPQRLAIHRQLAKLEAAQGETDAAIGRFREVLKRSPGERELREEFIRMLSDGERFDDAVTELEKLIELAPADAELYLQIAALRSRQGKPEAVLAALRKAHGLLGKDEGSGLRIASMMLQFGLGEPGEALLRELAEAPGAGPVAMEVLAAQYAQKQRKEEAVALLKKAGSGDDLDILLRTTGSISALGESATAFEILMARAEKFASEPRFLAALGQAGLAANKPAEVLPQALKLVRLAKQAAELAESINLASRVITAADKAADVRSSLEAQATRTAAETCLLASLIETAGDFEGVEKLLTAATDSMAVHFHAALLDRRGEFEQAIAVLSRLADTDEGRKAAYFKDLSELQQRAGKTTEALATVERWKLAAPGDKAAWITGSRLLRESGKPEDAVKMTRQAVARFEGDTDLEASLAALHDEAGQWADSEAIYWRLYDEGQSPADQARWGAQLAQLAQRTGKAAELEEKLRERARGNRRSIGPLLAQAELARVTNNESKRCDLLLEAVRLQPKDLDLRLQIADIEEKSGNSERVVAVLEEALPFDVNGRVRSALAQAYLRQGQAMKGMRELRLLSGKSGYDTRAAESAAASLAAAKLYDEGIVLLRTELKDGGDWRTRYLLAVLLEEDGREEEATPVFLSLLQAEGEIPGLVPPVTPGSQARNPLSRFPKEVQGVFQLVSASQAAYAHRNQSRNGFYVSQGNVMVSAFSLPANPEDVRRLALVHLCSLASRKTGKMDESLLAKIKAAGMANAEFVAGLAASGNTGMGPDYLKLLEAFPEEPGLLEWVVSYGGISGQNTDTTIFKRILAHPEKLSPMGRFNAWANVLRNAEPDDPGWDLWLTAAKDCIGDKSPDPAATIGYQLMASLQTPQSKLPEKHRQTVKNLILAAQTRNIKEHPEYAHNTYSLSVIAVAGTTDEWLEELNAVVRASREKPATSSRGGYNRFGQSLQSMVQSMSRGSGSSSMNQIFKVPTIEALTVRSLPPDLLNQLFTPAGNNPRGGGIPIPLADLVKRSEKIESPLLRACLAVKSGDAAAVTRAMAATPPREEAADFEILRSIVLLQEKKNALAFAALAKARGAGGADREFSTWINFSMLAVAATMTAEERAEVGDQLQAAILQCRQLLGQQGAPVLAAQADALGLVNLAKRLQPPGSAPVTGAASTGPAAMAGARSGSSSPASGGSVEKIRKFVAEKKHDAAAREVLLGIRSQNAQMQSYYIRNQLPELVAALGKEGLEALVRQLDPGDSRSLVRRLEFVDVCNAIGKPEKTRSVLEELVTERPDDAAIAARLIFVLSPDQDDRWIQLMTAACKSDELVTQAGNYLGGSRRTGETKELQDYFDRVARWLEQAEPADLAGANLSWVTYHGKRFFTGRMTHGLPSMLAEEKEGNENAPKDPKGEIARQKAVCERLARAMIRHASCAEEGYRLLTASKAWKLEVPEKDSLARQAILATAVSSAAAVNEQIRRYGTVNYFQFQSNNGSTSDGEDLADSSSVAWLLQRLGEEKNAALIFPPDFVTALRQGNAKAGELMAVLTRDLKPADLEALWTSEVMTRPSDRLASMLRPLLLKRFVATPGSTKFFVDRIAKIAPGKAAAPDSYGNSTSNHLMFQSALSGAAMGKPGELDAVVKAVKTAVFGDKVEFSETKPQMVDYQQLNFMESMLQQSTIEAPAMVRIQAAFFRLGLPFDDDEYAATRPFRSKRFANAAEAEAYYDSLGWLSEVDRWEPYAAMIFQRGNQVSNGNGYLITLKPKLMLEQVVQYSSYGGMNRQDLIKVLKERKKGRFGSLMMAAALSSEKERSDFAGLAFKESSAALAKLPPDRLASLSLVLPWLSDEAKAKLPEKLRARVKGHDDRQRQSALVRADQFLESLRSTPFDNMIGQADEAIKVVWPYDSSKAAAMMIATEQAYTDSLARGGRFSNAGTGEWEIPGRDYLLGQVLENRGSGDNTQDTEKLFPFIAKLLESPAGKRLAFDDSNYKTSLFTKLALPLLKEGTERQGGDRIVQLVEVFQARKGRGPQSVVFPAFLLADLQLANSSPPDEKRKLAVQAQLAKLQIKDPQTAKLATVRMALWAWPHFTPEEKAEARKIHVALLADKSIPDVARMALANEWLIRIPLADRFDEAFCAALVELYQEYATAGRSAITFISESILVSLASASGQQEFVTRMDSELARTFWNNAGAANAAGHPPIPSTLAQAGFMLAVAGSDKELIAKTFPKIKSSAAGKLGAMIALLQAGQFDLARQIAPAPAELFRLEEPEFKYTRKLETVIAAYKEAGADPLTLQKLEIEMLLMARGEKDEAPAESRPAQMERLAIAFATTPPEGTVFPWALGALLAGSPADPRLVPLLMAWAKKEPLGGFIITNNRSSGDAGERSRKAAVELHGMAAVHALALGDLMPMKALCEAVDVPINPNNGSNYTLCQDLLSMNEVMYRMVWWDVCKGSTIGYAAGSAGFNPFVSAFAKQIASYDPSSIAKPLALAGFLAGWATDPAPFAAVCEGLPEPCIEYGKQASKEPGFMPFLKLSGGSDDLKLLPAEASRAVFLGKILTLGNFSRVYPQQPGWAEDLRQRAFKEEIEAIALAPPEGTVIEALPALFELRGQLLIEKKKLEEAAVAFRKGLETCPAVPAFNYNRGALKLKLAQVLASQDQQKQAREIFATIPPEEVADWLKSRYETFAKMLEAKPPN